MNKAGNPNLATGEYVIDPKTGKRKLAAAVALGAIRTEAKAAASRVNGKHAAPGPGLKPTLLSALACTCVAGDALEGHKWDCPRGQAIKRRIKEGRDIQTGEKLAEGALPQVRA
jgi:hypothetical protein